MIRKLLPTMCWGIMTSFTFSSNVEAQHLSQVNLPQTLVSQSDAEVEQDDNSTTVDNVQFRYRITDRWDDGTYRIEIDFASIADAERWMASLALPEGHTIIENYGILISDNNTGAINISGDEWNSDLLVGEQSRGVIVVENNSNNDESIDLVIDRPIDADTNTPSVSSFSDEERQQFRDGYIAAQDNESVAQNNVSTSSTEPTTDYNNLDTSNDGESAPDSNLEETATSNDSELTDNEFLPNDNVPADINSDAESQENDDIQGDFENDSELTDNESLLNNNISTDIDSDGESQDNIDFQRNSENATDYEFDGQTSTNQQGSFAYGEVLQKSFLALEANRSGTLPSDNRIPWRSDSTLDDGSDHGKDLTGGYFDAGDHIKFAQPMAFSLTMLAWGGVDYRDAYQQSGQLDELLEAVKWGTDWILKAHENSGGKTSRLFVQVGDAEDHYHWVPPEEIANRTSRPSFYIDPSKPSSDVSAGMASALASASMLFAETDDAYSATLIANARMLFEFAETYPAKYSDSVPAANPFYTSWSGYWDELALASVWLYRATGESIYLQKAEAYFDKQIRHLGTWSYATDDHSYAAATLLARESSNSTYISEVKRWLDGWVNGTDLIHYTPGGFAHRNEWSSSSLTLGTAFLAEWYSDFVEPNQSYSNFATNQLDYLLGNNPLNFSYVIGFGENYPQRPHHRGSAGSVTMDNADRVNEHVLHGALVGGLNQPDDHAYNDRRDDWITNEVGTSYNAPLSSAAAQQFENFGGDPLSDEQLDQIIRNSP